MWESSQKKSSDAAPRSTSAGDDSEAKEVRVPEKTRIFVVSMRDSVERRRSFTDRARGAGIKWSFFDALSGQSDSLTYDEPAVRKNCGRPLRNGELGCYSSHYSLWLQLLEDEAKQYIILEDDVIVNWKVLRKLAQVNLSASGINYLRLYCLRPSPFRVLKYNFFGSLHLLQFIEPAIGTQGYIITRAGAQCLVDRCSKIVRPIDMQLDWYWEHGVPNLCIFPFPIMEEGGDSVIGDRSGRPKLSLSAYFKWAYTLLRGRLWVWMRSRPEICGPFDFAGVPGA